MSERDELLTPKQVYAEYGFSPQTLANWRWMDMGPDYIKQTPGKGGRIKYKRSAIEAWLESVTVKTGGAAA
ncbi:helix-turn-helix transcriptional regulator [Streptomyces marokkonensis]|uniref:helix-turn-helix transcriptional regulator n=1 Tax=Streptomyces marokkonensis TaxID=324855 RepID=UPI0011F22BE4|nr:helix-turn-helix domain-containing protein [Streptomyces marokkonensis]